MDKLEKLAIKPAEFAEMISVSRSKAYEILAANPGLSVLIGGSKRVPVDRLRKWLAAQAQATEAESH
jgi:hypothetical protein